MAVHHHGKVDEEDYPGALSASLMLQPVCADPAVLTSGVASRALVTCQRKFSHHPPAAGPGSLRKLKAAENPVWNSETHQRFLVPVSRHASLNSQPPSVNVTDEHFRIFFMKCFVEARILPFPPPQTPIFMNLLSECGAMNLFVHWLVVLSFRFLLMLRSTRVSVFLYKRMVFTSEGPLRWDSSFQSAGL